VALLAFGIASRLPLERLREHARLLWLGGVALLIVTYLVGHVAGGARSWLALGPMRIQPSELMKVLLPLAIAAELTRPVRRSGVTNAIRSVLMHVGVSQSMAVRAGALATRWASVLALIAVPLVLVAVQPDIGTAGLLGLAGLAVIWLAGVHRAVLFAGAGAALAAAPMVWFALQDYQRARILIFTHPAQDPSGDGYQTLQSLYAVSSGGWWGRGWGSGTQGRLGFLPEHTTDFILAHLAEEWGLLGALLCLGLLFALITVGLVVAERARDRFSALLAGGLSLSLLWQVIVNAGGILGLLPLTGVTLPFFSYGGSSLLAVWFAVGLLTAVARPTVRHRRPVLSPIAAPMIPKLR
jgi:rod shape determining protein RodA